MHVEYVAFECRRVGGELVTLTPLCALNQLGIGNDEEIQQP